MNLSPSYFFFLTFICFIFNRNSSTAPFVKPRCVLIVANSIVLLMKISRKVIKNFILKISRFLFII